MVDTIQGNKVNHGQSSPDDETTPYKHAFYGRVFTYGID